jgi:hypothetical protein
VSGEEPTTELGGKMQGKYDRNIDDLERARLEETRYWGPRYSETSPHSLNFQTGFGPIDPAWLMQQRMLQQPFQQMQNPISQYPSQFYQGTPQSSYAQNFPQQQFIPQLHPGFSTYVHPSLQPFLQTQLGFFPQQNIPQHFPIQYSTAFQPLNSQVPNVPQQQIEGFWGEYPERKWEMLSQRAAGRIPSRAFQRPPRNYKRSDELIRDEICKRLALTPEIDATDVEVIVRDGEVTLRGNVDDRFEKRMVEDIIECTFGVRDLLNEIRVGTRQTDQDLVSAHSKSKEK